MSTAKNIVRIAAKGKATHAIIFLHGLGDTGNGWTFLADQLRTDPAFNCVNFLFPTAPDMPITANNNYRMPAWFDIKEWDPEMRNFDNEGYVKSLSLIKDYVKEQIDLSIKPENIMVGGFSQGAALALGAALSLPFKIGGFISLSGFISRDSSLWSGMTNKSNIDSPIFHGHGTNDPVVAHKKAEEALNFFSKEHAFTNYKLHSYRGLEHSMGPEELSDLHKFIKDTWNLQA